jgi:sigma-E factor negative regulatory protein RseA
MNPERQTLPSDTQDPDQARAWLSALVDGEAEGAEHACNRWRDDEHLRRDWHAYQLIGDVMRSEDLAAPAGRDAAFLAGVRARLAAEPVVLAPQPVAARRRQPWLLPVAAAAGFVVVAGVLVVARMNPSSTDGGQLVARDTPAEAAVATQPVMLYDPTVQEYVRAHRSVGNSLAVAPPGGGLRRVDITVTPVPQR